VALRDIKIADLAFILSEIGSPVTYNGVSSFGIVNNDPTDVLQIGSKAFSVHDTELTMVVLTGSLGTLINNSNIVVNGITYTLHKPTVLSDGLETKVWLTKVN
jgi:hypothetical protein